MAGELLMSISKDERERAIFRNRRIAIADWESNMAQTLLNAQREADEKWQATLADKDAELADKDAELADKDAELADKDAELADKDAELADKDAELADKDAEIARLRAMLDGK